MTYGSDKAASVRTRPLGFESGRLNCVFVGLSLTDIAKDRNDILACFFMFGRYAFERPAPHFDPNELAGASRSYIPPDTKFKRAHVTRTCRIGKFGQKCRPISDVHAFEKFVADKFGDGDAEQRFGRWRSKNDRAAFAATDNNVRHVPDQKLIAILLCAEQLGWDPTRRDAEVAEVRARFPFRRAE